MVSGYSNSIYYVLKITRAAKHKINFDYQLQLHGTPLCTVDHCKYLGITIQSDLKWSNHIHNVTAKANRTLSLLRRNPKSVSQSLKETAYFTLVRPQLEYVAAVWSPTLNKDIVEIEKINHHAIRFVCNNYSYTESVTSMMELRGWEKLEDRRYKICLCLLYKIIHGQVCTHLNEFTMFQTTPLATRYSHPNNLIVPHTRTDTYKFSFGPHTCTSWNNLPNCVKEIELFERFKSTL